MMEERIDEIEEEKKRHQLFRQIWESTQKQREMFFEQEAEYAVVNKEKLPLPYREMKEFLGISIKKHPESIFSDEFMIFIGDIVPEEFRRYVVYHEWREGIRSSIRYEESHLLAVSEELWLAKKELSEVKFKQFIQWLEKHLNPMAKKIVSDCLQLIQEVEEGK